MKTIMASTIQLGWTIAAIWRVKRQKHVFFTAYIVKILKIHCKLLAFLYLNQEKIVKDTQKIAISFKILIMAPVIFDMTE